MKIKTRTEQVIDYQDWNKFVSETYGRPYNFQQQDGCKPSGVHRFSVPSDDHPYDYERDTIPEKVNGPVDGVSFKAWLARDPKKKLPDNDEQESYCLELFWERNFYPSFDMVVEDLYKRGLIKEGKYTINIDW